MQINFCQILAIICLEISGKAFLKLIVNNTTNTTRNIEMQRKTQEEAQQMIQNQSLVQRKQQNNPSPYTSREGKLGPVLRQTGVLQAQQTKEGRKGAIQAKQQPVQRKRNSGGVEPHIQQYAAQKYGADLSKVSIVENSSFPASVNAKATIQGNSIHVAPGESSTVKNHEIGHAIDNQLNGTPKADSKVNGQAVNTDQTRENAADRIGAELGNVPVQRKETFAGQQKQQQSASTGVLQLMGKSGVKQAGKGNEGVKTKKRRRVHKKAGVVAVKNVEEMTPEIKQALAATAKRQKVKKKKSSTQPQVEELTHKDQSRLYWHKNDKYYSRQIMLGVGGKTLAPNYRVHVSVFSSDAGNDIWNKKFWESQTNYEDEEYNAEQHKEWVNADGEAGQIGDISTMTWDEFHVTFTVDGSSSVMHFFYDRQGNFKKYDSKKEYQEEQSNFEEVADRVKNWFLNSYLKDG